MLEELTKRRVFRVLSGYAVVSFVVLQVADVTFEPLGIDESVLQVLIALIILALPIVAYLGWVFDVDPNSGVTRVQSPNPLRELLIFLAAVTLLATGIWMVLVPFGDNSEPPVADQNQTSTRTIAVLPFLDLSPQQDQRYFGDGIAEQILNELARIQSIQVASRTASFSLVDTSSIQEIGNLLGVAYVLEGSVRKDEDDIRVSVQLINVASGFEVWSRTFDQKFESIFKIQEEISRSVAGSMGVKLGVNDVNAFRGAGTQNVEAYELFLQGWNESSIHYLERAVELDPGYATAWSSLGLLTAGRMLNSQPEEAPALLKSADYYVSKALDLDPSSAQVMSFYGTLKYAQKEWVAAYQWHQAAREISRDASIEGQFGNMLLRAGHMREALGQYLISERIEPNTSTQMLLFETQAHIALGNLEQAVEVSNGIPSASEKLYAELLVALNETDPSLLAEVLAKVSRSSHPLSSFVSALSMDTSNVLSNQEVIERTIAEQTSWPSKYHDLALFAAYFDRPTLALELIKRDILHTQVRTQVLWFPVMREVRQLNEFREFIEQLNLHLLYDEIGWPDICRPLNDGEIVCL